MANMKGKSLAWENVGKGVQDKGMKPWKIQERDWMGEAPTQPWEEPGQRLDSLKECILLPKSKEM